jgi:hypothetical protein
MDWQASIKSANMSSRFEPLDDETFGTIRQAFLSYISTEFVHGPAEAGSTCTSLLLALFALAPYHVWQFYEINSRTH